jgi:hypothetical protein
MATRDYTKHLVSSTAPVGGSLGDQWYNPTTNTLSHRLAVNGTSVQWVQTYSPPVASTTPSLINFTEGISIASPNDTVPAVSLTAANNSYANIDFVAAPKGAGAILAQVPTGTTLGGNKRGISSVDFQMTRSSASQVAAGNNSFIGGGQNNTTTGPSWYSGIVAGSNNRIDGAGGGFYYQFIGAGNNNNITFSYNSTIVAGQSNNIGNVLPYSHGSFIGAGESNTVNGEYSAITAGQSNIILSNHTFIGSGQSNSSYSTYGAISGGFTNSTLTTASQTLTLYSATGVSNIALSADNANIRPYMVLKALTGQSSAGTLTVSSYAAEGTSYATSSGSGTGVTYTLLHAGAAVTYAINSWITIAGVTLTSGSINGIFRVTGSAAGSVSFASSATGTISAQGTVRQSTTIVTTTAATQTVNGGQQNIFAAGIFMGAGGNNQATGPYSIIVGGGDIVTAANRNSIGIGAAYGVIVGGYKNVISGNSQASGIFAGRDNTISTNSSGNPGNGNVIAGGHSNTISAPTFQSQWGGNFIGAGSSNTISSNYDGNAIICGSGNSIGTALNTYGTFIGGGGSNTANGISSGILSGSNNTANADYSSILGGVYGNTRSVVGYSAFPACNAPIASATGVSQAAFLILGVQTTDATATRLRSNTAAATTTNQLTLPNNSAYYVEGTVIAGVTGAGATKAWKFEVAIKRGANAAATSIVGAAIKNIVAADAAASTWDVSFTADTTNGSLAVTVTGAAATTIRWVCKLGTTEMTF